MSAQQQPTPEPERPRILGTDRVPAFKPKSGDVVYYGWLNNGMINVPAGDDYIRSRKKELPDKFYRTGFERNWTLSSFVGKDDLPSHPDIKHLKLHDGNASQNMGEFIPTKELNPHRIWRQTRAKRSLKPTGYISVFNDFEPARNFALWRASKARLRGFRIYIAEIKANHLVPVVIKGSLRFSKSTFIEGSLDMTETKIQILDAEIPAWVPASAVPSDGSPFPIDKYISDGGEMWLSLVELKSSNLGFECNPKHDNEWFSCGPIKKSQIFDVLPFDGYATHVDDGTRPGKKVISKRSTIRYKWNWAERKWVPKANR